MGFLWVVCGAGRGVGKTRLARALVRVLPGALHVKKGHHPPAPGKEGVYFQEEEALLAFLEEAFPRRPHLVVEWNGLALQGKGDLVIYLGPLEDTLFPREDRLELARRAHIRLETEPDRRAWKKVLEERLPDPSLVDPVLSVLEGMFPRRGRRFSVKSKLWIQRGGGFVLGPGLAALLEKVEVLGSLRKAAAERGISYRHAWDLVRKAESHLGVELLKKQAGGPGGGGSSLSSLGRRLLRAYFDVKEEVEEYARQRMDALLGGAPAPEAKMEKAQRKEDAP